MPSRWDKITKQTLHAGTYQYSQSHGGYIHMAKYTSYNLNILKLNLLPLATDEYTSNLLKESLNAYRKKNFKK